jgi:hypothetical protein
MLSCADSFLKSSSFLYACVSVKETLDKYLQVSDVSHRQVKVIHERHELFFYAAVGADYRAVDSLCVSLIIEINRAMSPALSCRGQGLVVQCAHL